MSSRSNARFIPHREEGALWDCKDSIHIPGVSLKGLNELGRGIIVWNVEPKPVRNSSWNTLTKAEGWVIQSIEEKWSRRAQEVLDVMLKCIDVVP